MLTSLSYCILITLVFLKSILPVQQHRTVVEAWEKYRKLQFLLGISTALNAFG